MAGFLETLRNITNIQLKRQEFDHKNNHKRILQPFEFEKLDLDSTQSWIYNFQGTVNWIAVCYLLFVFLGPRYMRDRKPLDLKQPLMIWNWILAIFSFAGFVRLGPTLLYLTFFQESGFYQSVCQGSFCWEPELFWGTAFTISKIFELIDTVFIVLRKSPLIFLHWYHHVSMMLFMFYLAPLADPCGRWNIVLNYGVHSIMYSYYALRMNGVQIPKMFSKILTSIQMGQFIIALVASGFAFFYKVSGTRPCVLHSMTMTVQIVGGLSYLGLFANFFVQTYIVKSNIKKKLDKKSL